MVLCRRLSFFRSCSSHLLRALCSRLLLRTWSSVSCPQQIRTGILERISIAEVRAKREKDGRVKISGPNKALGGYSMWGNPCLARRRFPFSPEQCLESDKIKLKTL